MRHNNTTFQREEELAEGVGFVGTTHTLYADGHYPAGMLTAIAIYQRPQPLLCSQGHSTEDNVGDGGPEFAEVFVIVWVQMFFCYQTKLLVFICTVLYVLASFSRLEP